MTDPMLIPCPHCNGLNRIPAERIDDHPKCGRCKAEQVSRLPYRYLCLHLLFQKLQHNLRHTFAAAGMLPYRNINITHSFGVQFYARLLSMPDRSTSELLRTL